MMMLIMECLPTTDTTIYAISVNESGPTVPGCVGGSLCDDSASQEQRRHNKPGSQEALHAESIVVYHNLGWWDGG